MAFCKFKGGKLPPQRRMSIPALGDFLDKVATWPVVPAAGWQSKVNPSAWGMLGNDLWGDCAEAGILHLLQGQAANTGQNLIATTAQALELYKDITDFNLGAGPSGANPTDNGTVLTDLLAHIQTNGVEMTDATGEPVTVEVVGSASLDISSVAQMSYAAYIFGGNYLGLNLPSRCEYDTTRWNFGPGLPLAGGHCVPQEGEGALLRPLVSWGMLIPASKSFLLNYIDEGYVIITKAWLNAQGTAPSGLDLNGLVAAMASLKANTGRN